MDPKVEKNSDFGDNLLRWVKSTLKDYDDIDLAQGFKSESFQNGKIFAGLINEFDGSYIKYKSLSSKRDNFDDNCKLALETAEEKMGIPAIIDYDDLSSGKCNDKQLQLYLSLMYNAYREKDLGMTKESLMKRVQELEEKFIILLEENKALKESLAKSRASTIQLQETLALTSQEHSKVQKQKDDLTTEFTELEERYDAEKIKWDEELNDLKNKKAHLSENSDATTTALQQDWENMNQKRDAVRDELRKMKEELAKEREELEANQKKLLSKLDRAKKTKEGLEAVMGRTDKNHKLVMPLISHSVIRHANDLNHWIPHLEDGRKYVHHPYSVPVEEEVKPQKYNRQVQILSKLLDAQNKNMDKLLDDRTIEAKEVVSVNVGKLKKRVKTKGEIELGDGNSESEDEVREVPVAVPKKDERKEKLPVHNAKAVEKDEKHSARTPKTGHHQKATSDSSKKKSSNRSNK